MRILRLLYKYAKGYRTASILLPIAVLVQTGMEVWIPYLMGEMLDQGIYAGDQAVIRRTGLLMLLAAGVMTAAGILVSYSISVWSSGVTRNIRDALFVRVQELAFSDTDRFGTASVLTRMSTDVQYVKRTLIMFNSLIRSPVMIIFTITVTLRSYRSVAGVFIIAAACLIAVSAIIVYFSIRHYRRMFIHYDEMNGMLEENITAQKTVRAFARGEQESGRFGGVISALFMENRRAERLTVLNEPLLELVINGSILALILITGTKIVGGTMLAGDFFCLISYADQILLQISILAMIMVPMLSAKVSIERILEVMDTEPAIKDGEGLCGRPADGSVSFRNVSMSYFEGKDVLQDLDIEIRAGEFTGIIGSSGSGKTSMIDLIPRFYDCRKGSVCVGGRDVREYALKDLRGHIGLVPQKSLLFSGTIADNLRWGNEDASAEDIVKACTAAGANDFIMGFPDGYDTVISQGGSTVSGGQRQRLCIARALIRKPEILILDDSLSAVDNTTEGHILDALDELRGRTTVIMVSQRFTSVMKADRIIVLDEGRIEAEGKHEELLESSRVYREIYETQRRTMA